MAAAIIKELQRMGFTKAVKALEKEIKKKFSTTLPETSSSKLLKLVEIETESKKKVEESSSDDSSSSSDDSSSDKEEKPKERPIARKKQSSDSSSSDSSDDDDKMKVEPPAKKQNADSNSGKEVSSSDDDSSSDESEPPKKKAKKETISKKHTEIVTPKEGSDASDSGSDVSDVEVSDVSSVSTSEDESSSSDDDSSSEEESSDDEDLAEKQKAKRKAAADKAKQASEAALAWTPKKAKAIDIKTEAGTDGAQALSTGKPFQRVDDGFWGEKAMKDGGAMADNSYGGVFGNDGFGAKSSDKLLQVRGKRFQHEKTKRKRSFNGFARTGGAINMESNSTKFVQ